MTNKFEKSNNAWLHTINTAQFQKICSFIAKQRQINCQKKCKKKLKMTCSPTSKFNLEPPLTPLILYMDSYGSHIRGGFGVSLQQLCYKRSAKKAYSGWNYLEKQTRIASCHSQLPKVVTILLQLLDFRMML